MDYREFLEKVAEELPKVMPEKYADAQFAVKEVEKLQGQSYVGIYVNPADSQVGGTVDLSDIFNGMDQRHGFDDALRAVSARIVSNLDQIPQVTAEHLMDYDFVKQNILCQMVAIDGNESMLNNIPHKKMEDMAAIFRIVVEDNEEGMSSVIVKNEMLEIYGVSEEQFLKDALEVSAEQHPLDIKSLAKVMSEMTGMMFPEDESPLYVATNDISMDGSGVIAYENFMDEASDLMGGDFFVLPSSIHEVLLVPDTGVYQVSDMMMMVQEANATVVEDKDKLTTNVYHYDSWDRVFETAEHYEERMAEMNLPSKEDLMTCLLVSPQEYPKVVQISDTLENLQDMVGGNIEVTYPFAESVGLVMNEEGKLNGLPLNRALRDEDGGIYDIIAGDFLVVGLNDSGFESLTPELQAEFEEVFHTPEVFVKMGKDILTIPLDDKMMEEAAKHDKGHKMDKEGPDMPKKKTQEER